MGIRIEAKSPAIYLICLVFIDASVLAPTPGLPRAAAWNLIMIITAVGPWTDVYLRIPIVTVPNGDWKYHFGALKLVIAYTSSIAGLPL